MQRLASRPRPAKKSASLRSPSHSSTFGQWPRLMTFGIYQPYNQTLMNINNIEQAIALADMQKTGNTYVKADLYRHVLHLAKRLSTIGVQYCNGTRDEQSYTRALESVNNKLAELLTPHKIYWYHQSDPRGASLYLSNEYKLTRENYNNGLVIY